MSSDELGEWIWPARIAVLATGFAAGFGVTLFLAWIAWLLPLPFAAIAILMLPSAISKARQPGSVRPWFTVAGLIGLIVGTVFWSWAMSQVAAAM